MVNENSFERPNGLKELSIQSNNAACLIGESVCCLTIWIILGFQSVCFVVSKACKGKQCNR